MSNVVSLTGTVLIDERQPNPAVIEAAEQLLEMARSGEITGLQCVTYCFDQSTIIKRAGVLSYSMVGRLHDVINRCLADLK